MQPYTLGARYVVPAGAASACPYASPLLAKRNPAVVVELREELATMLNCNVTIACSPYTLRINMGWERYAEPPDPHLFIVGTTFGSRERLYQWLEQQRDIPTDPFFRDMFKAAGVRFYCDRGRDALVFEAIDPAAVFEYSSDPGIVPASEGQFVNARLNVYTTSGGAGRVMAARVGPMPALVPAPGVA